MNIMNIPAVARASTAVRMAALALASLTIVACATAPTSPPGALEARTKLTVLQSDSRLANTVPVEIREAEAAVAIAEVPVGKDIALGQHRVYMADRKVEIAMATAETRLAEGQRAMLSQQRDEARLRARTREADSARREQAALAAAAAAEARTNASDLQRQIDTLQAEATDRGLVLTLGDVLFATGRSDLRSGRNSTLDKLVAFLNEYPDRTAVIEGHTDDVGSLEMNQGLSQRRADAVRSYLTMNGIAGSRLTAAGMGETQPISDNLSASGRQQNRRVEIIIQNVRATPRASVN